MTLKVTLRQERWYRLGASGLHAPFADASTAAAALIGVQSQILSAAGLALYNRTPSLDDAQFQQMLWDDRTLVKIWSQRGTLHVFPIEDWSLIIGAQSARRSWWERKLTRKGGDPKAFRKTVGDVSALMLTKETLGRSDLRTSDLPLTDGMLSSWGGMFHELVRRGDACHSQRKGSEGRFAHRERWVPELPWSPPSSQEANEEITARYFKTYGPSTLLDFAYWRGLSMRDTKPWLAGIADKLVEVTVGSVQKWIHRDCVDLLTTPAPASAEEWPLLMLYRFDPLLLGHKDKRWLVPKKFYSEVWRKAGHIEGCILQEGRITGVWRYKRGASACTIDVEPFAPLGSEIEDEIVEKAEGIAGYLGTVCSEVTFSE